MMEAEVEAMRHMMSDTFAQKVQRQPPQSQALLQGHQTCVLKLWWATIHTHLGAEKAGALPSLCRAVACKVALAAALEAAQPCLLKVFIKVPAGVSTAASPSLNKVAQSVAAMPSLNKVAQK